MPTSPRPPFNPWRDIDDTPIPQQCRIQQVEVSKNFGALPSRLHQQGQVIGRGQSRLIVRFDHENDLVRIRPHVVRVLTTPGGC
ncbi:MAG: hypothetical protein ACRDTH_24540 [Pseudonocardiaceae bacterium]